MAKTINTVLKLKDQFSKGINTATRSTKSLTAQTKISEARARRLANTMKADLCRGAKMAAKALLATGAAAAAGAYKLADSTAKTLDEIDKMSQKIGISSDAYQKLDYAMARSGADITGLKAGMKTFTNQMDAAAQGGGDAANVFRELGVEVTNADGSLRSQESTMFKTISALASMENQTQRARYAIMLFGRSGAELAPLLNQGAAGVDALLKKAEELGLVIDADTVKSGAKLNDTMDDVRASFSMVKTSIGAELIPYFQQFSEWTLGHMPQIKEAAKSVAEGFKKLGEFVKFLADNSDTLVPILAAVTSGLAAFKIITTVINFVTNLKTAFAAFSTVMKLTNTSMLACPLTWIVVGIMAVVGAVTFIIKKFGSFRGAIDALLNKFPGLRAALNTIRGAINAIVGPIRTAVNWFRKLFSYSGKSVNVSANVSKSGPSAATKQFATGTSYAPGGLSRINEGGRGELVTLPSGTKVLSANKTDALLNKASGNVTVNLTIQGNVIGNREFMEQTGSFIAGRIMTAMTNV